MARQVGALLAAAAFALFAVLIFFSKRDDIAGCNSAISWLSSRGTCDANTAAADVKASPASGKGRDDKKQPAAKKTGKVALTEELKDDATGIKLPRNKKFSKSVLTCLGVGVRTKTIVVASVNVYSVGLYVDARPARGALKKFSGADPDKLKEDSSLFQVLGQPGSFTKYLHLVFTRGVGAQKVVDALTSVKGVEETVLSRFSSMTLDAIGTSIGQGETVSLGWEGKDKFVVMVRDKVVGIIQDAALPKAVFDLYLGSNPVSPPAKDAFAEGVPALLNS